MALSPDYIVLAAALVRESRADVEAKAAVLTEAEEEFLTDDLDTYEAEKNSADFKMKGGSDGITMDSSPLLADIFYRVRNMLGFDPIPYDLNGPVFELVEIEVGQNFG